MFGQDLHNFFSSKGMENTSILWLKWCRLCANEDPVNSVSIKMNGLHQPISMGEDMKLSLKEALEKYFWIQCSCEDSLPEFVCIDCYSLISSIILFNERVERVQKMYKCLVETPLSDANELNAIRLKFMVSDRKYETGLEPDTPNEIFMSENGQDQSSAPIKQELCNIDLNTSKYLGFDNMEPEVGLFDEVSKSSQNQKGRDPFESNDKPENDTSSCGEETEIGIDKLKSNTSSFVEETELEKTINKLRKSRRKSKALRTAKLEKRRKKIKDIKTIVDELECDATCPECGKKISLLSMYCRHMRESHGYDNADKHWKCPLCENTLQSCYNFKKHMRKHMSLECSTTIKCPECDNRYTSIAQLDAHINYKHRNDKPFICEECGICVRTNSNLRQHMLIHTDNAPFECEICKKKFKNNSRLKIHMDIHSPNKHVCAICGMQLNSRATLNRHFLVHSDEMQHKCDYCGRAFKRAKALKNHLILHTGLKPYSCDFCDRTFANGSNCRSHMKKVHPNELASLEASGIKPHTKNIPKLETLKAVTKAADNLTPVVTKFSGCFAFGKKPKVSIDTPKPPKPSLAAEKDLSMLDVGKTTYLDPQNITLVSKPAKAFLTTNKISEDPNILTKTVPTFDNIYQQLMKQNQNELQTKKPFSNSDISPDNQNPYLLTHNTSFPGQDQKEYCNTLKVAQDSCDDILHSSSGYRISMTPVIEDNSQSQTSPYGDTRRTQSLPPTNLL